MEMTIERKWKKPGYTIGRLYVDGKYFCDTLEDTDRGLTADMPDTEIARRKVRAQTAIPAGTYPLAITPSPRFKRDLPLLVGVKGFSGVRIHPGNTAADTEGCILVGDNTQPGKVLNSRVRFNALFATLLTSTGPVTITIR